MKKIVIILGIMLLTSLFFTIYESRATDIQKIITSMEGVQDPDSSGTKIPEGINKVIGLLQLAGTGIALVIVSVLGIKYMLATPSAKADVKKEILPIIIGCALVFAGVNIVALIADYTAEINS